MDSFLAPSLTRDADLAPQSAAFPLGECADVNVSSAVGPVSRRLDARQGLRTAATLIAAQHGAVTRQQLVECGLTVRQVERRVANGTLLAVARGVYVVHSSADTWARRAVASYLVTLCRSRRCALSHETAAALWGFEGYHRGGSVIVTSASGDRHPNPLAIMVRASDLVDEDVVTGPLGIPTISPVRTAIDLAAQSSRPAKVYEVLERARHVVDLHDIHQRLASMVGRAGTPMVRRVVRRELVSAGRMVLA